MGKEHFSHFENLILFKHYIFKNKNVVNVHCFILGGDLVHNCIIDYTPPSPAP